MKWEGIEFPTNICCFWKFENFQKQQKVLYIIYADFESITEGLQSDPCNRTEMTEKRARHVASGFAYMVVR